MSPDCFLLDARFACSLFNWFVSARRTKHENSGLSGHPCGNPSSCVSVCGSWFSLKYHESQGWLVRRSKIGTRGQVASSDKRIRRASVRDTLLNMLVKSSKIRARLGEFVAVFALFWSSLCSSVGVAWLSVCLSIYSRTAMAVVWATKSTPPGIWIPYCPPLRRSGVMSSVIWTRAVLAATLRIAVPIPIGRNFSGLVMSLCSAKK